MSFILTDNIKELISKQGVFSFATSSKTGVPNVVPIGMLMLRDDGSIWVIDNFMNKTLANLKENPIASFFLWNPETKDSFQIKGKVEIICSGPEYEEAKIIAHKKKETLPAKNLLKFNVCDVYYTTPGPNAGKKI